MANKLTPEEFKSVLATKGWSGIALAERWDVSPAWISKIINDPDRAPHWDDAVAGLPKRPSTGNRKRGAAKR